MLSLFPPDTLDTSLLTPVLIGLLWTWFFQETLGWGLSGLVVPGYLAAVFALQPETGAVIAAEATLSYFATLVLSEALPKDWLWTPLFGRDRFFGFLVVSVGVRLIMEIVALPWIEAATGVEVPGGLHAIGLVVVPLAANAVWRSGLVVGVPRLGIPTLLTWAILTFVLEPHTNLVLTEFQISFEDLAVNFDGSARAYLILLFAAGLASQLNLSWGWDYGGILVPGLLALCWLYPERLVSTCGEALITAWLLRRVLRAPGVRTLNLTGGRPLVLGVVLAWFVKLGLGWALGPVLGAVRTRDLFGFGYLLPTLLAVRMVRHGQPWRALLPTLLTSLGGFSLASVVGYALLVLLPPPVDSRGSQALPENRTHALLVAAWTEEGDPPAHVDLSRPALVRAGQGLGGLWINPAGAPIAVAARVGPLGLAEAGLAVGETLQASAVLICGPEGPACEQTIRDLELSLPVLRVTAGEASELAVRGALPEALPTDRLGALVGAYTLRAGRETTLVLSRTARLAAAAAVLGRAGAPTAGAEPPQGAEALRAMAESVLRPWIETRGESIASNARALAAGLAPGFGLRMVPGSQGDRLEGQDWALELRTDPTGPIVVVPRVYDDRGSAEVGRWLADLLHASALITVWSDDPPQANHPAQVALLSLLAAPGPRPQVLTVRATRQDLGADVVVSAGRPVARPERAPAPALLAALAQQGLAVAWVDGSAGRVSLLDPDSAIRAASRVAAGGEAHLTLWAGPRLIARVRP